MLDRPRLLYECDHVEKKGEVATLGKRLERQDPTASDSAHLFSMHPFPFSEVRKS